LRGLRLLDAAGPTSGLSDYNIVVKGQSKIFLAGHPGQDATGEESDDESLGGAALHAEVSGLGDYFAEDEMDALRICREVVSHLNWRKAGPERCSRRKSPPMTRGAARLVSRTCASRSTCATSSPGGRRIPVRGVQGPLRPTVVCGWTRIHGYPVGVLATTG